MHNKLLTVISEILDIPLNELPADPSPETVPSWDSMKQIDIVIAVEEEFGVRFKDSDIPRLIGIRGFEQILKERVKSA
jgi:acyl carrier protein